MPGQFFVTAWNQFIMREKISACLTAGNEEKNVRRCLESLKWADEIVVVDSFSTDRTVEICKEYTNRVYQHKWLGYIGQKELIKKMATHPWVLFIDADEEVSPALRDNILKEFETGACANVAGYEFSRRVFYLGRWICHGEWWPDIKLRLFRKDLGVSTGREPHDRVEVNGTVKLLKGHLYHYTYDNVFGQVDTLNRFTGISAEGMLEEGRRFSYLDLLCRPFFRFLKGYVMKQGFRDGVAGFVIAVASAFGVFLKYAKLWEMQYVRSAPAPDKAGTSEPEGEQPA